MWLLPFFPRVARAMAFVYYRVRYLGSGLPATGPVLLVANHPNSLLDPMLVVAAARRPVRFLAKAPLFSDPKVGWLIRGAGAIPTYRRSDDPSLVVRNDEMFSAVHKALEEGDVVGLFPEGISHSSPSLAPLKTGAARIALGASVSSSLGAFPVIPVGLVFRGKETFRSEARIIVGTPVEWHDLSRSGPEDSDAVRELTGRIDESLHEVTINLDAWQDQPLVETAVKIWESEQEAFPDPLQRTNRLARTTRILALVRQEQDGEGLSLINAVNKHSIRLKRLGLRPADLRAEVGVARGAGWLAGRVPLVMPLAAIVAATGWLLFLVPYQLTGRLVKRFRLEADVLSTWKLMLGMIMYTIWWILLVTLIFQYQGAWVAVIAGIVIPVLGMAGLLVRESWRGAWQDAKRYLLLRSRRSLVVALLNNQKDLSHRLDSLLIRFATGVDQ